MNLKLISIILILLTVQNFFAQNLGPKTESISKNNYSKIYFVSNLKGSDENGNGTKENPWKTIKFSLSKINDASKNKKYAVEVSEGKYHEGEIQLKEFVDLYGGFDSTTWNRDVYYNETVLEGEGKNRIAVATDNSVIDGFVFRNGTIRGKGGAIYCKGTSPTISNNVFRKNKTLAPQNWNPKYWHKTANDGGAVYCEDGSKAIIKNNIFYRNNTENGRGGGVALNNKSGGKIINNIFIENVTGLKDEHRSSDGGAVSVFKWCNPLIQNNIFLSNKSLASNDAGGLFVALWSSPTISKNIFVGNECGDDAGALFVGGQEHRYDKPLDPLPPKDSFYVKINKNIFVGNKNPSNNSGVMRFTMESRGKFSNNLCAYNNGIYFQRSETEISNNTILENFLLIETKKGLKESKVYNNIIWGDIEKDTPAEISFNDSKNKLEGEGNFSSDPLFKKDNFQVTAYSTSYNPFKFLTNIFVSGGSYKSDELKGRIIKSGNKWGIVESNTSNNIEVIGNLSGNIIYNVIPSFNLSPNSPCINKGKENKNIGAENIYSNLLSE